MIICPKCNHTFSESEYQNICHDLSHEDKDRFTTGCQKEWAKLFGDGWKDLPDSEGWWWSILINPTDELDCMFIEQEELSGIKKSKFRKWYKAIIPILS